MQPIMKIKLLLACSLLVPGLLEAKGYSPEALVRSEAVPSDDQLKLAFPGKKKPADYEKYGKFEDEGSTRYRYATYDRESLSAEVGEGIYPNTSVLKDPAYKEAMKSGKLSGNQWKFVDTRTAALNFYKWTTCA